MLASICRFVMTICNVLFACFVLSQHQYITDVSLCHNQAIQLKQQGFERRVAYLLLWTNVKVSCLLERQLILEAMLGSFAVAFLGNDHTRFDGQYY